MSTPKHNQYLNTFNQRNQAKDFSGYLFNFIHQGTNCSAFETNVIVDEIASKINLFSPNSILPGQLFYSAVSADEPAGKEISNCEKKNIILTLISPKEDNVKLTSQQIRQKKIIRLANEALEQGALLTQEDLSVILNTNVRTIRKDIKILKEKNEIVPLRGVQKDIGRSISHKVFIINEYLAGVERVDLINRTKHSLHSIERYLTSFGRVIFLYRQNLQLEEISYVVRHSKRLVEEYVQIYEENKGNLFKMGRILELTGEKYKKKVKKSMKR